MQGKIQNKGIMESDVFLMGEFNTAFLIWYLDLSNIYSYNYKKNICSILLFGCNYFNDCGIRMG